MSRLQRRNLLGAVAVLFGACGPAPVDPPLDDAGLKIARDAGTFDAGAAPGIDAGADAGLGPIEDAGAPFDAGNVSPPDAGTPDAGVTPDAGATDASVDAGMSAQADAGSSPMVDAGPPNVVITVDLAHPGRTVPDDFLGLSVEWNHVPDYLGDNAGQPRAVVLQLLNNFASDGHHPVLRIGGNSEDKSYWNPNGLPTPSGVTTNLTASHLDLLSAIHEATGSRFILGLNLNRQDPTNAADLVQAARGALDAGAIEAFELGNEPDLYFYTGYRPFYYSPFSYQSEFDGYFPQLSTAAGGQALFAGPALYSTTWVSSLGGFINAEQGRLAMVTLHRYPFNVCLTTVGGPTIPSLFTDTATMQYATVFAPIVQTATNGGVPVRVAEMNSISCGGTTGVSDVFASGLWGADAMFQLASVGVSGVNLHTPSRYAVFSFDSSGALEVRGLYYAMLLFSRATASHGRLVPVTVQSSLQVRAWATVGTDGVARVAVINEDLAHAAAVSLTVPTRAGPALQWALSAPTLDATTAISFGAQTFQGSTTGLPSGASTGAPVGVQAGAYRLTLPAGSAALVAVPP